MGILERLFGRRAEHRSATGGASRSLAAYNNIIFSESLSKKVSAVDACERLIAESIAKIPIELKRYNATGKYYMRDVSNPLFDVLAIKPNARMTSYDLIRGAIMQMLNHGNAYLLPVRNALGDVEALYLLEGVAYDRYSNTYSVNDTTNQIHGIYTAEEIIHLRNFGSDGYLGESTIRKAARVIGISSAADNELSSLFATGSRFRGIISGDSAQSGGLGGYGGNMTKQLKEVRDMVTEELRNGETITFLPGEMKFTPFSMTPADVQLLDNKKFTVDEIARFFGVPASLIGGEGGGSYSNAEGESVRFMNQTLSPMLRQIEVELTAKLIRPEMRGYYRIQFEREALYTTDLTTKANYMKSTIEAGVRTVNEWRRADGYPMLNGGDEAVVSANLVTLKSRINEGNNQGNTQS